MKVRGRSAGSLAPLPVPAFCGVANGLEYRERDARWECSAMIVAPADWGGGRPPFFARSSQAVCDRDGALS